MKSSLENKLSINTWQNCIASWKGFSLLDVHITNIGKFLQTQASLHHTTSTKKMRQGFKIVFFIIFTLLFTLLMSATRNKIYSWNHRG